MRQVKKGIWVGPRLYGKYAWEFSNGYREDIFEFPTIDDCDEEDSLEEKIKYLKEEKISYFKWLRTKEWWFFHISLSYDEINNDHAPSVNIYLEILNYCFCDFCIHNIYHAKKQ